MNSYDLRDRVAVVTGGARGIGLAIVRRLLAGKARVAIWDLDGPRIETAVRELGAGPQISSHVVELTNDGAVENAAEDTVTAHGKIDILVNNAGITGGNGVTWEIDPLLWRRVVDVNLIAPFLTCRAVVPKLLLNGYGRIVNISSIAGKDGNPNASHYSASKAGLIGLTKSLGKELATRNVLVNCVTPAAAQTEIFDQMKKEHIDYMLSRIPMNRFVKVDEIAALVCWLCSEECSFSTGAVFDISGGRAVY